MKETNKENETEERKKYKINVTLSGRQYNFVTDAENEELIRKAFNMLNTRMNELAQFEFVDSFDQLTTAAMQCLVWLLKEKKKDVSCTLLREIKFLDEQLGEYINNL